MANELVVKLLDSIIDSLDIRSLITGERRTGTGPSESGFAARSPRWQHSSLM